MRGSHPFVYLAAGSHRLSGNFAWDTRPGSLRVPLATGLLSLILDGRPIAIPDRRAALPSGLSGPSIGSHQPGDGSFSHEAA